MRRAYTGVTTKLNYDQRPGLDMQQYQEQRPYLLMRLHELLVKKDFEASEMFSGIAGTAWGLIVGWPWINTFATSPSFRAMAELAPEWAWGVLVLLGALGQLAALIVNQHRARYYITWAMFLIWLFVAITFMRANLWSTATGIYPTLAAMNAWAIWRLRTKPVGI